MNDRLRRAVEAIKTRRARSNVLGAQTGVYAALLEGPNDGE